MDRQDVIDSEVRPAIMGESGKDIKFSGIAKIRFPYAIECKNTEKFNAWSAYKQAKENATEDEIPLVVFKRNRSEVMVLLSFSDYVLDKHNLVI